ncbi:Ca2+/Na+ antiporter [Vibrio nigripulchritudo SOn1]|uniref:Ca2+/Na+ antiporter n=1 Tax=Vibrio nigripulchritudo SOn1 TaxID=1238450 RepID=A0AAV2VZW8_9VIBR|nr:calcium/sodium antiporter [Vibrio nigripulchritudo]CCO50309.1 Ca2+/Na+ antiporter [Vibrio nigripulchritudo SOn1]
MFVPVLAVALGLICIIWSADRFVDGAAASAKHLGLPTLLIGMVIIGFGTSAPEMIVSMIAANQGNSGLALGNGFGSNVTNIALILGLTAVLAPISVHSRVLKLELPLLVGSTVLVGWLLADLSISRQDGVVLLLVFALIMGWSIYKGIKSPNDPLGESVDELLEETIPLKSAIFSTTVGLILLVLSSRLLVWGAVEIATSLGVSDLLIGLTIVAVGTSLPELAASVAAVRKKEHDLVVGGVVGSNLFNTLTVIGIAGVIQPINVEPIIWSRDYVVMAIFTGVLFILGYGVLGRQRINRIEGMILLLCYITYMWFLVNESFFISR